MKTALMACALILAACGGDDDDTDGGAAGDDGDGEDAGTAADAGTGPADTGPGDRPDADLEVECPPGALGDLGAVQNALASQEPFDSSDPDGPQTRTLIGDFGETRTLSMLLLDGRGVFAAGAAVPGTYALGEAETSLSTCGACLQLVLITDEAVFGFLPTAGSLTLDSVDVDLAGGAADLAFQQMDPETGTLLAGGCTATADAFSFTAPLPPPAISQPGRRASPRAGRGQPPPETSPR